MTIARKHLIDYSKTCFYHCMSRCVRQHFLLDSVQFCNGQFNYRNEWIQRRLLFLSDVFAIDLLSFAIMDNHTHLVLHANVELAQRWSNLEVLKRWSKLGTLPLLCQLYLSPDWRNKLNDVELAVVLDQVDGYRHKLMDISMFMSSFNYYIARRANKEDNASGHFWEARFKSQALLDSQAVLSCMHYVDLNPIRSKKAKTLYDSHFTSIYHRLDVASNYSQARVLPICKGYRSSTGLELLPHTLISYIESLESLLDQNSNDKKFNLSNIDDCEVTSWREITTNFESVFKHSAGKDRLVDLFNQQATMLSGINNKYNKALADSILDRLRDYQYLSEKRRPDS